MAVVVHHRKCAVCRKPFEVSGHAAGRKTACSDECKAKRQRQHERNYRESHFNPWRWENTILDWDE